LHPQAPEKKSPTPKCRANLTPPGLKLQEFACQKPDRQGGPAGNTALADARASDKSLKIKSTLKLDHPSSQTALGATEGKWVLDLRARAVEVEGLQIQKIEDIEKVRLYLQESSFAEYTTQTELLGDSHIDVKVMRSAKRVSTDARQLESG